MSGLDSTLGFVLQSLKELVIYNADLISGLKGNVKDLYGDLDTLKVFIKTYTEKYQDNEILEKLAGDIRSVVYRAEDAIEKYIHCATLQNLRNKFDKTLHLATYLRELKAVGKEIEKVTKEVQDIYNNRANLGFRAIEIEETSNNPKKKKTLVVEEDNVVGFEDATNIVLDLLTGEGKSESLEVISIIGMLGLGKTTLAKKVLSHPKIEYEFYTRAFVNVSQEYERREVFTKILRSFTQISSEQMNKMSDDQVANELKEQLKTRRYLIVMDDVWTPEAWHDLKVVFPNNNKSSRVLITSRNTPVAVAANQKIDPYNLRFLYPEESQELLRRKVFGENSCPPDKEEYEVRILRKCDGLPLAIVVIAGILVNHRDSTHWWRKVADDVNDYYARNTEQTYDVIKLSYNHMPYSLKPCFLYLGVFREDLDIPVWKLLRLWIAEGLIPQDGNMTLEAVAEDYLEELVDRNLVMVGNRRATGQIKTCRIHDTLRDFCKNEAKKENLFQEIKKLEEVTALPSNSNNSIRRLCVNAFVLDYIKSKPSGEHVRSFLSFAKEETTLQLEHVSSIPKAFKLLRVLDTKSIIFTRFPTELLYLVLLKYIAISSNFKVLPEKVSNLLNLQTLIVETSSRNLDIKADIWKLGKLRHVQTNASTRMPSPKPDASPNPNLQTLATIAPESCTVDMFSKTPKLKKLGICGKLVGLLEPNAQSGLANCLVRLDELENLKLLNDDITSKLHSLPSENMFPKQLVRLTLLNTLLDWRHMSTLGKLEKLEVLKLKDNAFRGEFWETEQGGFRSLKVLHIGSTNLVRWKSAASHFPQLRSLFLRHCTQLEAIPPELGDISTLQKIDLYCTNARVATSARKIEVLKLKIQAQKKVKGAGFRFSFYPPDH